MVVSRLDRLGRSLPELLALVEDLAARSIGLRSLDQQVDTTCAAGRLVLHVFGALSRLSGHWLASLQAGAAAGPGDHHKHPGATSTR
ncbi:recombinase family protein [Mycobacterium sherrisii]|uniref:recombinase family protein n=1 Tax=Mycobacterium sherrisii TaxID=243061 RepID=UPI003975B832